MNSSLGFNIAPIDPAVKAKLAQRLDEATQRIVLHQGTEPPFCGAFTDHAQEGVYVCVLCALPLFDSTTKFKSRSGWPSFYDPVAQDHIRRVEDRSHMMVRTEIQCARCEAHLGHVFPDGPPPSFERHCLNSLSLEFIEKGQKVPDLLKA